MAIDQYGNQFWTARDWDEFFGALDKLPGTVRQKFKDFPLMSVPDLYSEFQFSGLSKPALNRMLYALCGKRIVAPIVCDVEEDLTQESVNELADILVATFKEKWDRQKAVYDLDYDPIYNQKDVYSETTTNRQVDDIDVAKSKANELARSGSDTTTTTNNLSESTSATRTDNLTQTVSGSDQKTEGGTNQNDVYGLNSISAVHNNLDTMSKTGSSSNSETQQNTGTVQDSGSKTNTGTVTQALQHGRTDNLTESGQEEFDIVSTGNGTKQYTRYGNIGNILTQDMIQKEIDLWKWNILEEMMNDIKSYISVPLYV